MILGIGTEVPLWFFSPLCVFLVRFINPAGSRHLHVLVGGVKTVFVFNLKGLEGAKPDKCCIKDSSGCGSLL